MSDRAFDPNVRTQSPTVIDSVVLRNSLEAALDYETNPIARARVRRLLRNDRAFARFRERVSDRYMASGATEFDFNSIFEWITENWDTILKILLTVLPLLL